MEKDTFIALVKKEFDNQLNKGNEDILLYLHKLLDFLGKQEFNNSYKSSIKSFNLILLQNYRYKYFYKQRLDNSSLILIKNCKKYIAINNKNKSIQQIRESQIFSLNKKILELKNTNRKDLANQKLLEKSNLEKLLKIESYIYKYNNIITQKFSSETSKDLLIRNKASNILLSRDSKELANLIFDYIDYTKEEIIKELKKE